MRTSTGKWADEPISDIAGRLAQLNDQIRHSGCHSEKILRTSLWLGLLTEAAEDFSITFLSFGF